MITIHFQRQWRAIGLAGLAALLWLVPATAQEAKSDVKLPKGVSAIKKEDLLSKVPNFFSFGDDEGKRYWLRVDDKHFIERYPDGLEARFKIVGAATVNGKKGTIAAKIAGDAEKTGTENDGTFQVFIPNKDEKEAKFMFRRGEDEWGELAELSHAD